MNRTTALVFTILFACCTAFSQETKSVFLDEFYLDADLRNAVVAPRHTLAVSAFPGTTIDSSIDVLTYELELDWVSALLTPASERPVRKFTGHVKAYVIANVLTDTVPFNSRGLMIDSIFIDGAQTTWEVQAGALRIVAPQTIAAHDTVVVDVYYAGLSDARGFTCLSEVDAAQIELPHAIAYTMSEPEDARRWYPCHDVSPDKAIFTVHVRVPKGFKVVSNGTMQDSVADSDTSTVQTWHHPHPMSTYLLAVNASTFTQYNQEYVGSKTIPIANFHWPEDQDGDMYSAVRSLVNIPKMFEVFEKVFGEYPWPTYGHVTVSPFQFGGMEHQSMTSVNRRWLRGDVEIGYAHELGHQWLGDAVTCATWADIWLNEGGASYSEALWREGTAGFPGYQALMNGRRAKYMEKGLAEPPVYGIPITNLFNEGTTYCKSAWVYHMIRRLAGDDAFFSMLKSWIHDNMHQARQTFEFLEHVQAHIAVTPVPWDVFFDQWLVQQGHPRFVANANADREMFAGMYKTSMQIGQAQDGENIPVVFLTPLTVRLMGQSQFKDTTVMIDTDFEQFEVYTSFVVDSVVLDPLANVLCEQFVQFTTDVNEESSPGFVIGPVPAHRGNPLYIRCDASPTCTISVRTLDGRMLDVMNGGSELITLDTHNWPVGVVSVVITSSSGTSSHLIPVTE